MKQPSKKHTDNETTFGKKINNKQSGKKQTDKKTTLGKKLTGDNPVKNKKIRRQPWVKIMDWETIL
jgi:hypothetical protein